MKVSFKIILGTCAIVALLSSQPVYAQVAGGISGSGSVSTTSGPTPNDDPIYGTDDVSYTGYRPANIINPNGWGEGGDKESQDDDYSQMNSDRQQAVVESAGGEGGGSGGGWGF